jgi:hypothetical protein
MVKLRKIAIVTLCVIFVAGLGAAICLDLYYFANLPREPTQMSGRIHRLIVSHGSVHYGTQQEVDRIPRIEAWPLIGAACGLITGVLNFVGTFRPQEDKKPRHNTKRASYWYCHNFLTDFSSQYRDCTLFEIQGGVCYHSNGERRLVL